MMSWVESLGKKSLKKFGIEISCLSTKKYNLYDNSLKGAMSVREQLNIIQVGANDGRHNDPIYEFVKEHKRKTNIILIEPIKTVIPYLKENYSYHPSVEIINKGIGGDETSSLQLYTIKKDYWSDIQAGYGGNWPEYRIPTGVTTSNKDQLIQWVSDNVQSDQQPIEIIEELNIELIQPETVVSKSNILKNVDLLQIDAEGMDDEIVYSFLDDGIFPSIINIETAHLNEKQQKKFNQKLSSNGYEVHNYKSGEAISFLY